MKKSLFVVGVLTTVGLGTTVVAETTAPTAPTTPPTQVITGKAEGSTDFKGRIGLDPGSVDPNNDANKPGVSTPPIGDNAWIKVEIPTTISYYSSGTTIQSGSTKIKNLSNFPVKVTLTGFKNQDETKDKPDVTGIDQLKLNDVFLVEGGAVVDSSQLSKFNKILSAGGEYPAGPAMQDTLAYVDIKVTGTTKVGLTETYQLNNKLVFSFKALDSKGNEVPATKP